MKYHNENGRRWREGKHSGPVPLLRYTSASLPESHDGFAIEWWSDTAGPIYDLAVIIRCPIDFEPKSDGRGGIEQLSTLFVDLYNFTGGANVIAVECSEAVRRKILMKSLESPLMFERIILSEPTDPNVFRLFNRVTGEEVPVIAEYPRTPNFWATPQVSFGGIPYPNSFDDLFREMLLRLDCDKCKTLQCPNKAQPNLGLCQSCWRKIPAAERRKLWGEHKAKLRAIESKKAG